MNKEAVKWAALWGIGTEMLVGERIGAGCPERSGLRVRSTAFLSGGVIRKVTCTPWIPVSSIVIRVGLTWLFHETQEAKALVQRHSVHFCFLVWAPLRPDGTQNKQNLEVTGTWQCRKGAGDNRAPQESAKGQVFQRKSRKQSGEDSQKCDTRQGTLVGNR